MEIIIQISIAVASAIFLLGITHPNIYIKIKNKLLWYVIGLSVTMSVWNGFLTFFEYTVLVEILDNKIKQAIDRYYISWIFVSLLPIVSIIYGYIIGELSKYILKTKESKEEQ